MRRRNLVLTIFIMMLVILLSTISCTVIASNTPSAPTPENTQSVVSVIVKDVNVREAYEIIQNNNSNPGFIILDVRTPDEYDSGYIVKAINIDYQSVNFKSEVSKLSREDKYLVYCQAGGRSAAATQAMTQLGFKEILNLTGGIADWTNNGYPVAK
jgi:rhodanese-related sulfurtransferase